MKLVLERPVIIGIEYLCQCLLFVNEANEFTASQRGINIL